MANVNIRPRDIPYHPLHIMLLYPLDLRLQLSYKIRTMDLFSLALLRLRGRLHDMIYLFHQKEPEGQGLDYFSPPFPQQGRLILKKLV